MSYPQLHPRLNYKGQQEGIDWDRLRADYEAQLDRQVAAGVDDYETKAWAAHRAGEKPPVKPAPKPKQDRAGIGGSKPSYDRRQIVMMYEQGRMTVDDIAKQLGAHRQTIRNNLTAAGVTLRDDRKGNPNGRMGRKPKVNA